MSIFQKHINSGNDFIDKGKSKNAREYFKKALNLIPENAEALDGLAWTYYIEGNYSKAKKLLEKAIEIDPTFAEAYTDLGCVMQELGEFGEAEKLHKYCLKLNPERADAKHNLAILYYSTDRFDEAEAFLENSEDLVKSNADLLFLLGEIKMDKEDFSGAADIFKKCLEFDPHNVEAGIFLTQAELELEE
jgi:tetratricopeptide (TPR) repeat protein